MDSRTLILITGANQGLGYYAAQQLAATGKYKVLIGSRDISKAEKAIQTLIKDESSKITPETLDAVQIDVDSDTSIAAAAQHVADKYGRLDILLNNAAIASAQNAAADGSGPSLRDLYRAQYETNVFGPAVVTDAFLPLLRKSSVKRIAFTSSGLGSLKLSREIAGTYSGEHYPIYRSTKAALNMIMVHYTRLLDNEGFVVSAADPGYCATNLNSYNGLNDPRNGAKWLIEAATGEKELIHGHVVGEDGVVPW